MSSLRVSRDDADRARSSHLLTEHYTAARASVLRKARGDLFKAGHFVTDLDLDAAYNAAWLDLVAQVDQGVEHFNPRGWLVIATKRRAIDGRRRDHSAVEVPLSRARELEAVGDDLGEQVDRKDAVLAAAAVARHKFSERDGRIAAMTLSGHSRSEISAKTGLPLKRIHKILDGHKGRRGLLDQLDDYLKVIAHGDWCEANASLIRAYTLRILGPGSPKIAEAQAHLRSCPACRAYSLDYGRAQEQLGAALAPVWGLAGVEVEVRFGVLQHLASAVRAAGDSARSLLGIGGADGAAAAGGGVSLGGGALAIGGLTAGRAVTAGCLAAVSVGCVAAATGVLPGSGNGERDDSPPAVVRRAATPGATPASSGGPNLAAILSPAASPTSSPLSLAPVPTLSPDADAAGEPTEERPSPLAPPEEFAIEAGGGAATPTRSGKVTKPKRTHDMSIENQTSGPAKSTAPAPSTAAAGSSGGSAAASTSSSGGTSNAGASSTAGSGTSTPSRAESPPAPTKAPEPQHETFGIER